VQEKRAGAVGRARYLREHLTPAEAIVWRWLRGRRFGGWKFRRQHPVGTYILDFYCEALGLAIELDGGKHVPPDDLLRSAVLTKYRIKVIRLSNDDVLHDSDGAAEHVADVIETLGKRVKYRR
jgi:very-short-patch-repair endonuclease